MDIVILYLPSPTTIQVLLDMYLLHSCRVYGQRWMEVAAMHSSGKGSKKQGVKNITSVKYL